MTVQFIAMIALYWIFLVGAVFLTGSFSIRYLITGPAGADVCIPQGKRKCLGEQASLYIFIIALVAFTANAAHLVLHASVITETPLNEIASIIVPFLLKTKYGKFTLWRSVFLFAMVITSFILLKKEGKVPVAMGMIFSFCLLIAMSMSGHQGAKGYLNIPFSLDVIHLIAVTLWIGGLFILRSAFSYFMREAGRELFDTFRAMIHKWSDFATWCVFIGITAGGGLSFYNIENLNLLTGTNYGIALMIKMALATLLLILGGVNKFFIIPSFNKAAKERWEDIITVRKRLSLLITVEAYTGLALLLATSFLTHLSPEG